MDDPIVSRTVTAATLFSVCSCLQTACHGNITTKSRQFIYVKDTEISLFGLGECACSRSVCKYSQLWQMRIPVCIYRFSVQLPVTFTTDFYSICLLWRIKYFIAITVVVSETLSQMICPSSGILNN
jgi:hypothetical protein